MFTKRVIACGAALLAGSCGPSATEAHFDSANPAARLYAIERAARTGDITAAAHLVEQLDSGDPVVRLLAIAALERLTGETYGYLHYDPPHLRRPAIRRWVEAVQSDTLPQTTGTTTKVLGNNG